MGTNLPGYRAGPSAMPREILYAMKPEPSYLPHGAKFDSGFGDNGNADGSHIIRAGWLVGKTTTGGKWRPLPRTQVAGTSGSVTAIVVDDASAFKVGDVITVGTDVDKTITAIDYVTNTITWVGAITVADNEVVFVQGGAGVAMGILADHLVLQDADGNAVDQIGKILIAGAVNYNALLGDAAAVIAAWTTNKLNGIQIWDKGTRLV